MRHDGMVKRSFVVRCVVEKKHRAKSQGGKGPILAEGALLLKTWHAGPCRPTAEAQRGCMQTRVGRSLSAPKIHRVLRFPALEGSGERCTFINTYTPAVCASPTEAWGIRTRIVFS